MGEDIYFFRSYEKSTKKVHGGCAHPLDTHEYGTIYTFFACTKKVPKKYTEGVRPLSTPMRRRKTSAPLPLRMFYGDTGNSVLS